MSKTTLPDRPARVKPEPLHPTIAMLRMIEHAAADRDRLAAAHLKSLCRTVEGTGAANAA